MMILQQQYHDFVIKTETLCSEKLKLQWSHCQQKGEKEMKKMQMKEGQCWTEKMSCPEEGNVR